MRKIVSLLLERKKFILYTTMKIFIMFLGLITNIFIVRKLSVEDYGIFSIAFMLIGLLTTFGFSWSSSSIIYFGSKEKSISNSINKTFWARNIIIFFSLIIMTILFFIFNNQINRYVGLDIAPLLLVWLYVSVTEDYLSQYFLAIKRQYLSGLLSVTAKLFYIILILTVDINVEKLIVINIISHSSVIFYILGINKKDVGTFEFDKKWFREVLNFSLWQLFGFSGVYLINFGDIAVIKHFMPIDNVGIYNAAYKLFSAISSFSYVISSYFASSVTTYFEKKEHAKIKNFFAKERWIIIAISTVGHLILMVFSKQIIATLYGEDYMHAVGIFRILLLGSIFRYVSVFHMLYFNINKRYKYQQLINLFRAVINVILDIVLIKVFGIYGPAIATSIAIISTVAFSTFYCEKRIKKMYLNNSN